MSLATENSGGIPATMLVGPTGGGSGMPYPVYTNGVGNSNGGFGDGNSWWVILLIIILLSEY